MKNRPLSERLGFAVDGLAAAWRRERSFLTHVGAAVAALMMLIVLHPRPLWWAAVAIVVAVVIALELVNAAVETLVDLLHPGIHPDVKIVKDMLAGAVLMASIAALWVAVALVHDRLPILMALMGFAR